MSMHNDLSSNPFVSEPFISRSVSPRESPTVPPLAERYQIGRLIGRGAYSSVYSAYDTVRQENVALKIAEAPGCDPGITRAVLEHENRIYKRVSGHPHILTVHDLHYVFHEGNNLLVLSMVLADGGSLREWLERCFHDYQRRLIDGQEIFMGVLRGVHAIHKANVVHRDIKPDNILFVMGRPQVADFGAARTLETIRRLASSRETHVPNHGTPPYMSPEMLAIPTLIDKRSDIYALGAVAYEMFSRECRPPVPGAFAQGSGTYSSISASLLDGLPQRVARVICRCLEDL